MNKATKIMAWLFIAGSVMLALSRLVTPAKAGSQAQTPDVYKDYVTGCEYLASYHDGALTPRIAADGKHHMGCKDNK